MTDQKPVDEPNIQVDTRHIRPLMEEEWVQRKPTSGERTAMATAILSLKDSRRKYEFTYGYDAYFMTIENANSGVQKWINPENSQKAIENGRDVSEKVSLIGQEGYDMGSGHKVNLMCANQALIDKYVDMLNTQHRDIRFVVFTDKDKRGASSSTSRGDKLANIDMVELMEGDEIEQISVMENRDLSEFRPNGE